MISGPSVQVDILKQTTLLMIVQKKINCMLNCIIDLTYNNFRYDLLLICIQIFPKLCIGIHFYLTLLNYEYL